MHEASPLHGITYDALPWPDALDSTLHEHWSRLATTHPVFHQPAWCLAARDAGVITPWRLLVIRQQDELLGLLPLARRSPWSGEIVAPLAHSFPPRVFAPGYERACWQGVAAWFRAASGLGMLSLGLTSSREQVDAFTQACDSLGLTPRCTPAESAIVLALPASWDAYLAGLDKHTRKVIRRVESLLAEEYPTVTATVVEDAGESAAIMTALARLYRLRWRDTTAGTVNTFDDPRHVRFYQAVMADALRHRRLGVGVTHLDDRMIVVMTIFHTPGQQTAYGHFIARDVSALPNRYSPGIFLLLHQIRWLIGRGASVLHLGVGNTGYKTILGGVEQPQWALSVARSPYHAALLSHIERGIHLAHRLPLHLRQHLQRAWPAADPSG